MSSFPDSTYELMNKSEYDKVIFHEVADSYATDHDIQCQYTLTSSVVPQEGDRVALFKVGWEAPHLYCNYVWAKIPEASESNPELCVTFKAEDLPKDDGVFYQFCYVCSDGIVRGASIPFRFCHPINDELIEIEDTESDLLIIRTRTAVIEERLREFAVKNNELMKSKTYIEKLLMEKEIQYEELIQAHLICQNDCKSLREEINATSSRYEELIKQLQKELNEQKQHSTKEAELFHSQTVLNEAYAQELRMTIKQLSEEKDVLASKGINDKKEKEKLQKNLLAAEDNLKLLIGKTEQLKKELDKRHEIILHHQQQIHNHELREPEIHRNIAELKEKVTVIEGEKQRLVSQLVDTEHMLAAMEKSKHLATEELMIHADYKKKVSKDLEKAEIEMKTLDEKCQILEEEKKQLLLENEELEKENNELKMKYSSLKDTFDTVSEIKKKWTEDQKYYNGLVEDLRGRLEAGAVEYQTKYLECLKLERKLGKIKKKLLGRQSEKNGDVSGCRAVKSEVSSTSENNIMVKETETNQIYATSSVDTLLNEKDLRIKLLEEKIETLSKVNSQSNIQCMYHHAPTMSPWMTSSPYPYQPPSNHPVYTNMIPTNPYIYEPIYRPPPLSREHSIEASENESSATVNEEQSDTLPPPIQPEVTTLAKLAAITAVSKNACTTHDTLESVHEHNAIYPDSTSNSVEYDGPGYSSLNHQRIDFPSHDFESIEEHRLKCPFCDGYFDSLHLLEDHTENVHMGLECPLCSKHFEPQQQTIFENHVQSHFVTERNYSDYEFD